MTLAVIGAGQSAAYYLQYCVSINTLGAVTLFTSDGSGQINDLKAEKITDLAAHSFDKIVICSQFIDEIKQTLASLQIDFSKVYFFDFKSKTESPLICNDFELTHPKANSMLAVYDLQNHNLTFNFSIFVSAAHAYAINHGYKGISFIVIKGGFNQVSFNDRLKYSKQQFDWRISNLLPAITQLSDLHIDYADMYHSEMATRLISAYDANDVFPNNAVADGTYLHAAQASHMKSGNDLYSRFGEFQYLRAPNQAKLYLRSLFNELSDKKVITLSIRSTTYQAEKNASLQDWIKLNDFLVERGYQTLIVPDISQCFDSHCRSFFKGAVYLSEASINLQLRCAAYEMAYFNVSVASGAGALLFLNPNVRFMMCCNEIAAMGIEGFEQNSGLLRNQKFPFMKSGQWMFWHTDRYTDMRDSFLSIEKALIEQDKQCQT